MGVAKQGFSANVINTDYPILLSGKRYQFRVTTEPVAFVWKEKDQVLIENEISLQNNW